MNMLMYKLILKMRVCMSLNYIILGHFTKIKEWNHDQPTLEKTKYSLKKIKGLLSQFVYSLRLFRLERKGSSERGIVFPEGYSSLYHFNKYLLLETTLYLLDLVRTIKLSNYLNLKYLQFYFIQ